MSEISIEQYLQWMKQTQGYDFQSNPNVHRYDTNVRSVLSTISDHPIIREIEKKLQEWAGEYEENTHSSLFMQVPTLSFFTKPYQSVIDKTFRINALWNEGFPDKPPKEGWVTPENVFSSINDLIRTYLVCKFIDGPKFLVEKLDNYCSSRDAKYTFYSQERDEGYYAYHFYIYFEAKVLDANWDSIDIITRAEIQMTTQLQEVLKGLTHQYFEVARLRPKSSNKWKWDFDSNRFRSAYMGHTLHLLEAIILDLRGNTMESNSKRERNNNEIKSSNS